MVCNLLLPRTLCGRVAWLCTVLSIIVIHNISTIVLRLEHQDDQRRNQDLLQRTTSPKLMTVSPKEMAILQAKSPKNAFITSQTGKLYEPGFYYANPDLCLRKRKPIKLLILITSPPAPEHQEMRQTIRDSWGHFALRQDVVLGFMLGRMETPNKTVLIEIQKEIKMYNDLIVGSFVDTYDNLTLKTLSMLEWTSTYCNQSKYLLKTDDDVWINVENLLNFIQSIQVADTITPQIYGHQFSLAKPERDSLIKSYVSEKQYPAPSYPVYINGPAYLLSTNIVKRLYTQGLKMKFLRLEDVFITGVVAKSLGINRSNVNSFVDTRYKYSNFHNVRNRNTNKELTSRVALHNVNRQAMLNLWKAMAQ